MNFIIAKLVLLIFMVNVNFISVVKSDDCVSALDSITQQDTEDCTGYFELYDDIYVQQYCPLGTKYDARLGCCIIGTCPPCNCEKQNRPLSVVTSNPACDSTIFTTDDGSTTISVSYSTTVISTTESETTVPNDSTTEESTETSSTAISTTESATTTDSTDESSASTVPNDSTTEESTIPTETASNTISTTESAITTDSTDASSASTVPNDSTTEESTIPTETSTTTISTTESAITTVSANDSSTSTISINSTTNKSTVSTDTSSTSTTTTTTTTAAPVSCINLPTGTFLPDPQHCNQYYVCVYGDAVHMYCPAGLWIDIPQKICNYPQFVECAANRD